MNPLRFGTGWLKRDQCLDDPKERLHNDDLYIYMSEYICMCMYKHIDPGLRDNNS